VVIQLSKKCPYSPIIKEKMMQDTSMFFFSHTKLAERNFVDGRTQSKKLPLPPPFHCFLGSNITIVGYNASAVKMYSTHVCSAFSKHKYFFGKIYIHNLPQHQRGHMIAPLMLFLHEGLVAQSGRRKRTLH
jgi:hypothetical protein